MTNEVKNAVNVIKEYLALDKDIEGNEYLDSLRVMIQALESQEWDCISREQAKKFLYDEIERLHDDGLYDCFSRIIDDMYNELPSVTPERPKGKWIGSNGVNYTYPNSFTICSVCKCHSDKFYKYCPNCGAYMREGGEDENNSGC